MVYLLGLKSGKVYILGLTSGKVYVLGSKRKWKVASRSNQNCDWKQTNYDKKRPK